MPKKTLSDILSPNDLNLLTPVMRMILDKVVRGLSGEETATRPAQGSAQIRAGSVREQRRKFFS